MSGPVVDFSKCVKCIDAAIRAEVERVSRMTDEGFLGKCAFEIPETSPGACNGLPCSAKATVHDLETEQDYCATHFWAVTR